jgi:hypothetical protein
MIDSSSSDGVNELAPWEAPRLKPLGIADTLKSFSTAESTFVTGSITSTVGPS